MARLGGMVRRRFGWLGAVAVVVMTLGLGGGTAFGNGGSFLPLETVAELSRLGSSYDIVVLGGTGVVSHDVWNELGSLTSGSVTRLAGRNRYATAAAISAATFSPGVPAVYVATGANFPDAQAAGPVAALEGAPILLATATSIPSETKTELTRLSPQKIVIVGGTGVISSAVEAQLAAYTSGSVTRLAGADRYATAAAISASWFSPGVPVAYVATGANFPDALAGVPAAVVRGGPILLVAGDLIPSATKNELARLQAGEIVVLGGTGVVADSVKSQLASYTTGSVIRLDGTTRYGTAAAISAATFSPGVPVVYIATGVNFPDALAGGPAAGIAPGPILLAKATPLASFGDGIWLVGSEIPPGTYRNSDSSALCYGARLSGLGGTIGEIIANNLSFERIIVTIEGSDAAFQSIDCGIWSNNLAPITSSVTASFAGGHFLVGSEISPGLWRNSDSSEGCYWERLTGFSWELADIIANSFSFTIQTVAIASGDVGFFSEGCGTWTKIG